MAGKGVYALYGAKPGDGKALSAHVTERAWAAESGVKAAMASGIRARVDHDLATADTVPMAAKLTGQHSKPVIGKHGTIQAGPLSAEHPRGKPGTIIAPAHGGRPLTASQKITSGAKGSDSQKLTLGSLPASPATGAHPVTGSAPTAKAPTGATPKAEVQPADRHVGVTMRKGADGVAAPVEVRVLGRKGQLFMHTSADGKKFGVTHGPSGNIIAEVQTKQQARALMNGMSRGKTVERALAGDARAVAALKKYGTGVVARNQMKLPKQPAAPKPARIPGASMGHGGKGESGGGKSGHGGKIPKADFSGIVHPFQRAAGILPGLIQHGVATAQTLSGLAAITQGGRR